MSSLTKKYHKLRVNFEEPGVKLCVLDAWGNKQVDNEKKMIDVELPQGLYTLRAERNGIYQDKVLRLNKTDVFEPTLPKAYSAIPLPDAVTTHEYYSYKAREYSQQYTTTKIEYDEGTDSSLFIFIRALSRKSKHTHDNQTDNLSLIDLNGNELSNFSDADVHKNVDFGYTAFCAKMSPSTVILNDMGTLPRQTQIPLLSGFQTQIFIMHTEHPLYEDMRVLTVPNHEILTQSYLDPYAKSDFFELANQIDVGMAALQNDVGEIGDSLVNSFLKSKFSNPLLGLLGAYLMLLRRHQKKDAKFDDSLPKKVINNLERLIPESADVIALKYLAAPWLGEPEFKEVRQVPFFRVGAEVLIRAAAQKPELIPEGCLFDIVSERIYSDTIWTSWNPVSFMVNKGSNVIFSSMDNELGWVELALADIAQSTSHQLELSELATIIGVTQRSITNAYSKLSTIITDQPDLLKEESIDIDSVNNFLKEYVPPILQLANQSLTYQAVYPVLKSVLSEVFQAKQRILASDEIQSLTSEINIDLVRDAIYEKLQENFPQVTLDKLGEELSSTKTVRDIARLVMKGDEL